MWLSTTKYEHMASQAKDSRAPISRYGALFPADSDDLGIELSCIAQGGHWTGREGQPCGLGLFEHFMNARKLIWPNRYRHRWTDLMYENFIENDVSILAGSASSQKTSHSVEFCLINYWARPDDTLVILSTTNMDKMDVGVWAELKMLWRQGRDRWEWLAGNVIDYKRAIATDDIEVTERDFRKGCICRPCYHSGRYVGLGVLAGIKQKHIFYVADELQFMASAFSASWPHLFSNGQVKIIGCGNFKHDPGDELSKTSEPDKGWNSMPEPQKTEVWSTRFMGGKCVNLVGTDSPNFDVPETQPEPYPGLIGRKFARRIEHDHGVNSFEWYQLVKGVMRIAFAESRVITRQLCREHRALELVKWKNEKRTKVYGLDPSYGGGDRCVGMPLEFGLDVDDTLILKLWPYEVYRLDASKDTPIEYQIAEECKKQLDLKGIEPRNCFYDAGGKGTLGNAFSSIFGGMCPVAVDSGARPTTRPVRQDLFIDDKNGNRRLKRCDEHYSKFVSEMWYSVRYVIEANQLRELTEDVMEEGCARIWYPVAGNKIEVEPKVSSTSKDQKKREDLKRRLNGKSPDLFDALVIGCEGARQRGFQIARLGKVTDGEDDAFNWLAEKRRAHEKLMEGKRLAHV